MNSRHELESSGNTADGPPPMKDFKPVKMRPNSVDQWQSLQEEYEDRGKCTSRPADRVRLHNSAYPQLRDELEKRRSLATVNAVQQAKGQNFSERDECLNLNKKNLKNSRVQATGIGGRHRKRRSRYTKRNMSEDSLTSGCCSRCRVAIAKLVQTVYDKEPSVHDNCERRAGIKRKHPSESGMSRNVRKRGKRRLYSPKTLKIRDDIDGNDGNDGNSSESCKKFETRPNSVASEHSLPSYNSSISLNLENEPMVRER